MYKAPAVPQRLSFGIRFAFHGAIVVLIASLPLMLTTNLNAQDSPAKPFISSHSANPPRADFTRPSATLQSENANTRSQRDKYWRGVAPIPLEDPGTNGESGAANAAVTYLNVLGPSPEALPAKSSELVAIGHVTSAQGFVTPDKTGVYSEFSITVDRVLKGNQTFSQATVIGIRRGGQVHFPSGHTTDFLFKGVGYPKQGPSYLFFLHQEPTSTDFEMMTAYELNGTKVSAIDNVDPFIQFDGLNQGTFLEIVKTNISHE
jgi:hypothetical protein